MVNVLSFTRYTTLSDLDLVSRSKWRHMKLKVVFV